MRRLFSFAVGVGLGVAAAFLISRALRRARRRIPEALMDEARETLASFRSAVTQAVEEGRRAMRETESDLRRGTVPAGD